jgi:cytochrome c-type protein NapB
MTRAALAWVALVAACGSDATVPAPGRGGTPSPSLVRAARRAYDGAPPTIPHPDPGAACSACHDGDGQAVGAGFAPASPHVRTPEEGATLRCRQCHVFVTTERAFVDNDFIGLPQNLRPGGRATPGAPPTIPHRILMRETCVACHAGPGARPEIRSRHPERTRCRQCHVAVADTGTFPSAAGAPIEGG